MSSKDRADFLKWHGDQKDKVFNFAKEMEEYCRADVDILRKAIMTFRQLLMAITTSQNEVQDPETSNQCKDGVDVIGSITIASLCMNVFKRKCLEPYTHVKLQCQDTVTAWLPLEKRDEGEDWVKYEGQWSALEDLAKKGMTEVERETLPSPIALVPSEGYVAKDQYSKISIQWLEWIMKSKNIFIQHALNKGEYRIPGTSYAADGYCRETNTIFEYLGCFWHGCKTCFPNHREMTILPRTKQSVHELYALTLKKNEDLKKRGFKVVFIWGHQFEHQIKTDKELKCFISSLDLQERLDPRDSFFGGRTNATKLYHEAEEGEEILYADFTSLYPYVNKCAEYPVAHPQIITQDFQTLDQYFGIAKVKVLSPRGLYHPVLPYKSNGKLKFALCRSCADTEQHTPCHLTDDERAFMGTWCIPELLMALEKGYTIVKIYEVYHWEETLKYNKETGEQGLFSRYINMFLKSKQESSGWPSWCKTDQDKEQYVRDYHEHEGISLDPSKIEKNPGLRALSKLQLNSFWGRLGMRLNMSQSKFFHANDLPDFYALLTDPSKEMHDFHILTDNMYQVQWTHHGKFVPDNKTANIFLATFTTCYARLKLYSVLDMLGERVLYYDTDSIIFNSKEGDVNPPLGDYLGELTDELDGDPIEIFVSGGPKNYAYRTKSGKEMCKVRGFTLNYLNSQIINFEAVKNLVLLPNRDGRIHTINPSKICRHKVSAKIYNRVETKTWNVRKGSAQESVVLLRSVSILVRRNGTRTTSHDITFRITYNVRHRRICRWITRINHFGRSYASSVGLLFTQGCHHRRLSVIFITQNLFGQAKSARTITLNTWYLVLFKNMRDTSQIMTLGRQLFPGRSSVLVEAYTYAVKSPYGYLVIDMSPHADDKLRLRTKVFPGEDPLMFVPSV